jgi:hypothetical protein
MRVAHCSCISLSEPVVMRKVSPMSDAASNWARTILKPMRTSLIALIALSCSELSASHPASAPSSSAPAPGGSGFCDRGLAPVPTILERSSAAIFITMPLGPG